MTSRDASGPIEGIEVRLEQSETSPPTVTTTVTNHNDHAVTFVSYGSPLDDLALQTGLFSITPAGAGEPVELPVVMVQRLWPPTPEALISVGAGASEKRHVVLKEPSVPMDKLGSKAAVRLSGNWQAVWATAKDGVDQEALGNLAGGSGSRAGTFLSNSIDVTIS